MERRAILLHGMNDASEGANNLDLLIPYLEGLGYKVIQLDYGWRGLLGARFLNWWTARKLTKMATETDIIIAYSNGVSICAYACGMGLKSWRYIWIHGALNPEWEPKIDAHVERIDVYYDERDWTTALAETLRRYTPLNYVWGETNWGYIGTVGSKSESPIFHNHKDGCDHFDWIEQPRRYVEYLP